MKKKTQFLLNLALTLFFVLAVIVQGPNLNPLYQEGAFSWCFMISCYVALNFFVCLGSLRLTTNEFGKTMVTMDRGVKGVKNGFILLAILWVLYLSLIHILCQLKTVSFAMPAFRFLRMRVRSSSSVIYLAGSHSQPSSGGYLHKNKSSPILLCGISREKCTAK